MPCIVLYRSIVWRWLGRLHPTDITLEIQQRLSYRLGLTRQTDPVKIERDLMKLLPQNDWIFTGHAIVCAARRDARADCQYSRGGLETPKATQ